MGTSKIEAYKMRIQIYKQVSVDGNLIKEVILLTYCSHFVSNYSELQG